MSYLATCALMQVQKLNKVIKHWILNVIDESFKLQMLPISSFFFCSLTDITVAGY